MTSLNIQLQYQVWNQMRTQVWDKDIQLQYQVWNQMRTQVWDKVRTQVDTQVHSSQLRDQVFGEVWTQVRNQVCDQLKIQVRNKT